eukprot:812091-Rhodomonas_salina.1
MRQHYGMRKSTISCPGGWYSRYHGTQTRENLIPGTEQCRIGGFLYVNHFGNRTDLTRRAEDPPRRGAPGPTCVAKSIAITHASCTKSTEIVWECEIFCETCAEGGEAEEKTGERVEWGGGVGERER